MAEALPSLSSFKEQFDNQLTCNICLDQYTHPKILPCYHSFCLECIQLTPIEIKNRNYYIKCPTCRIEHLTPEGGAANLPNDFEINTSLHLQKKLVISHPIHNDPLRVYCETCRQVICQDCTISEEHKTHKWHLIGKATLKVSPCSAKQTATATLTLHSQDGTPFSLPPSLISSTLSSPGNTHSVKCDITQTRQPGKYNITFTPSTRQDQLIVQVGGVDIPDSPFNLPVIITPEMRGKPIKIITGLNGPIGIAVCDNGDIVVAEYGADCITTLNKEGKKVKSFGTEGTKEDQFTCPRGVAITNDGHILVTDDHFLTTDGVYLNSVGSDESGSGQLQFDIPIGITVHPNTGQIFVADSINNRIQVFNNDKTFSQTIAPSGNKQFHWPYDVALDNNGYLYVADFGNHCITKLTTKGKYVTRFGSVGSAPGQLSYPDSLTINNGLVYVTEYGNNRVSIFDTSGTFLHCFGKRGSGGEGEFAGPQGITTDTLGNLYVSDTINNRIVVC